MSQDGPVDPKRWNLVATDLLGLAVVVDSFWTRRRAAREARFYNALPGLTVDLDGEDEPLVRYTVERCPSA